MKPKSVSFFVCLAAAIVFTGWTAYEWSTHKDLGGPQFDAIVISGYAAFSALALSFLISPLARIAGWAGLKVRMPLLVAFRRSLGLLAAWMAAVHFATILSGYLNGKWEALLHSFFLNAGTVTFLLLVVLTLSSFPPVCRKVGIRMWNELHMLTYAAAVFAVFHVTASAFAPVWVSAIAVMVLPGLILVRLVPRRKRRASQI